MPIHEYLCDDCGSKFEKLVRSSQTEADIECPSCGEAHVTEQLSRFAAHANGSSRQEAMPSCGSGMCGMPGMCGRN
jgi:putative FmdB family regulatory protein